METLAPPPMPPKKFGLHLFAPAPAIPLKFTDSAAIQQAYRSWRWRILLSSIIGYATFYFVRKNLAVAMPPMERDLHISIAGMATARFLRTKQKVADRKSTRLNSSHVR